ncbi:MAG: F0F1 ATP synthase subunit A [Verrucomicrobia bacterium]|nr:F0F1 ATP synthase subunit A [Verrucomicrobiota bacterium]
MCRAAQAAAGAAVPAPDAAAVGHGVGDGAGGGGHGVEHHALPNDAPFLGPGVERGGKWRGAWPVTNSMIMTWGVALLLIVFARIATRRIRDVPAGAQNFWEWLVEMLYEFLEGIVGKDLVRKTFWFFATIFILILFLNWAGLIPGVGTIGWGVATDQRFVVTRPLLRGADADMNLTFAMAMIFFACWLVWALQANGVKGFILHLFGPKGDTSGVLKVVMIFVFIPVGLLEVVSILFRPVSLSFRLYGNIFAGENMVETMINMSPVLACITPIPFYLLEVLVGLVQALVFMLLTAVFTMLICMHDEESASASH